MADPRKIPERLAEVYAALAPDPNAEYGALLPFARDKTTGDRRLAMPEMVRDGARGLVDLLAGTETGEVTPEAVQSLVFGGLGAGGALAPRGAMAAGGAPIRGWHASPHSFEKFDASKIGTGEGAQSFGHGLYFAENPAVSGVGGQYYKQFERRMEGQRGADLNTRFNNIKVGDSPLMGRYPIDRMDEAVTLAKSGNSADFQKWAEKRLSSWESQASDPKYQFRDYATEKVAAYKRLISDLNAGASVSYPRPHVYEVGIHQDPAKMLNWDAPMSAQPKPALQLGRELGATADMNGEPVGRDLYRRLRAAALENMPASQTVMPGAENVLTQQLLDRGVPGVRYLDGMSRVPGQGSSNYVMFPGTEESIEILRKYGMAAPAPVALSGGQAEPRRSIFENVY